MSVASAPRRTPARPARATARRPRRQACSRLLPPPARAPPRPGVAGGGGGAWLSMSGTGSIALNDAAPATPRGRHAARRASRAHAYRAGSNAPAARRERVARRVERAAAAAPAPAAPATVAARIRAAIPATSRRRPRPRRAPPRRPRTRRARRARRARLARHRGRRDSSGGPPRPARASARADVRAAGSSSCASVQRSSEWRGGARGRRAPAAPARARAAHVTLVQEAERKVVLAPPAAAASASARAAGLVGRRRLERRGRVEHRVEGHGDAARAGRDVGGRDDAFSPPYPPAAAAQRLAQLDAEALARPAAWPANDGARLASARAAPLRAWTGTASSSPRAARALSR